VVVEEIRRVVGDFVGVLVLEARVEHLGALGADWQGQALVERVQEDEVAQHVALHREQEGVAAALQPLE